MTELHSTPEQEPTQPSPESMGAQYENITTASGEEVTIRTDAKAMRVVAGENLSIGQTTHINGNEVEILGVAPQFTHEVVSPDDSRLERSGLWLKTTPIDGEPHVGFLHLEPGETYEGIFWQSVVN